MDWLTEPFAGEIAQRALLEVLVLAVACGPLGVWVLLSRQAYATESIGHGLLPGIVLAALVSAPLGVGAALGVIVTVAALTAAGADERIGADAGPAVAVTALTGLGALLALAATSPPRLDSLLFGDLLGVSTSDLALAVGVAVVCVIALASAHRRLLAGTFDPGSGRRHELVVLVLAALATAAAAPALGSLLLLALLLAPAAAALRLSRGVTGALLASAGCAALAGALGILVSHHLEVAAGASVALCALGLWCASWATVRAQP